MTDNRRHRSSHPFPAAAPYGWILFFLFLVFSLIPSGAVAALDAKARYHMAEACQQRLMESPEKQQYRHHWIACIEKFYEVFQSDPAGSWAAAGLFQVASLYEGLYGHSGKRTDIQEAVDTYQRILRRFPDSAYAQKAASALAALEEKNLAKKSSKNPPPTAYPANDEEGKKKKIPGEKRPQAFISGIRHWSNPTYTRVVVDVADEVDYTFNLLKSDSESNKLPRLYVDLSNSRLERDFKTTIPINDDLLSEVRAGQYQVDSVRIVLDIKSFESYKIFSLRNPFRIVIDIWGESSPAPAGKIPEDPKPDIKIPKGSLAKQLALGVRKVVVDPGHGGKDFGAPGYIKGVHEKDITLSIGKKLAKKIQEKLRVEVVLTRDDDRYLTLEERTAIANTQNADLFVSIHANSSRDHRAYGLETYFLNLATDEEAILVAARENATSTKNISDLQKILFDLMHNAKVNESSRLAGRVQHSVVGGMKKKYDRIKDKGVKQAPFYVLLGAQMPAILIETSFISNARECERLMDPAYQERLCDAIIEGLDRYIREAHPVASNKEPNTSSGVFLTGFDAVKGSTREAL